MTKQEIPFWIVATLITLAVVIIWAAVIYGRSLVRMDREKKTNQRLRVEEEERKKRMVERPFGDKLFRGDATIGRKSMMTTAADDDTTQILPGVEP